MARYSMMRQLGDLLLVGLLGGALSVVAVGVLGVVLDPFMGSGSTGKAAMLEGFRFIGCELSLEYLAIALRRIEAAHAREALK